MLKDEFIIIKNTLGLEATLSRTGAGIYSIKVNGLEMVCSPANKEVYLDKSYYGKVVGPFAGRRVVNGEVELHSASRCTGYRVFDVIEKKDNKLVLGLEDEGLVVTYEALEDKNALKLTVDANSTGFLGYVNHAYFNLGALPDAKDHVITMAVSNTSRLDDKLLMYEPIPVTKELDFRKGLRVGTYLESEVLNRPCLHGYDHRFIFDKGAPHVMVVESERAKMTLTTTCDAIQMYSTCWPTKEMMTNGYKDCLCSCLAIEPHFVPTVEPDVKDGKPNRFLKVNIYEFETKGR